MFFKSQQAAIAEISETFEQPKQDGIQELNLDSLSAYLQTRFSDRKQSNAHAISELLNEFRSAGFKSMNEVQRMVDENLEWFLRREQASPPGSPDTRNEKEADRRGRRFAPVGVLRIILNEKYLEGQLKTPPLRKRRR